MQVSVVLTMLDFHSMVAFLLLVVSDLSLKCFDVILLFLIKKCH